MLFDSILSTTELLSRVESVFPNWNLNNVSSLFTRSKLHPKTTFLGNPEEATSFIKVLLCDYVIEVKKNQLVNLQGTETEISFICWFILKMVATAGLGQDEAGAKNSIPVSLSRIWQGHKYLSHPPLPAQAH